MKPTYTFYYNKYIKEYIITSSNAKSASISYLVDKNNHDTWDQDEFKEYKSMLEWVLENYPEWAI